MHISRHARSLRPAKCADLLISVVKIVFSIYVNILLNPALASIEKKYQQSLSVHNGRQQLGIHGAESRAPYLGDNAS